MTGMSLFPKLSMPDQKNKGNAYLKYSGLAFQIVFTILIFIWGGRFLDEQLQFEVPWFTLTGAVLGVGGVMVYLIRNFSS